MQADSKSIYEMLFLGNRVKVQCATERDAHRLRVSLAKRHKEITAVELSNDSLCMDWEPPTAIFWLGQKRRAAPKFFEVYHEPISDFMGDDPRLFDASSSSLPEEKSEAVGPSSEKEKDSRKYG